MLMIHFQASVTLIVAAIKIQNYLQLTENCINVNYMYYENTNKTLRHRTQKHAVKIPQQDLPKDRFQFQLLAVEGS